jgi:radical SAM protein with 4Fe4S-binding SPASM domain
MKYHTPPFLLRELKIELTHVCGLNCIHCSSSATLTNTESIDVKRCAQIIDEAADIGVKKIAFSGGEPLSFSPVEAIVEKAARKHMEVAIYTSGYIEGFKETIGNLHRVGLCKVIFSLYSNDAVRHEKVSRTVGSHTATLSAIKHAVTLGLLTELHFVPFSDNYTELGPLAILAKELGINAISVLRFVPQGRGKEIESRKLNAEQNSLLKANIEGLRKDGHNIRTGSPYNFLLLNDQPQCCAGIDRMTVLPNLRIYPCDAFKRISAESLVGTDKYSRLDRHSLEECWLQSPYLGAIRDYLTSPFPAKCAACCSIDFCLSGCLAQKVLADGSIRKSADPDCLFS